MFDFQDELQVRAGYVCEARTVGRPDVSVSANEQAFSGRLLDAGNARL